MTAELLMAIALLCQTPSGSELKKVAEHQRDCQIRYIQCVNDRVVTSARGLAICVEGKK